MNIFYIAKSALSSLLANKVRSILTILGIVIGITSIMVIVSMGAGAQKLILGQLQGIGADMVIVRPGREPTGPTDIAGTIFANSLKTRDVQALSEKTNVPEAKAIAPVLFVTGNVSYQGDIYTRATTLGWDDQFMSQIFNVYPEQGTLFNETDIQARANVAVIGANIAKEFFPNGDALQKNIKIAGKNFRVVGVLPPKGQVAVFNMDDLVVVPYTTAQSYLLGIDYYNEVMVRVTDPALANQAVKDITYTLRQAHHITDPSKDDFFVVTQQAAVQQISTILNVLTMFLSAVVAISLLVGGIGVMNIMLVSVTERTREIGLRKAIGATERNIMTQFLIETIMLTGLGGLVGIILGTVWSFIISLVITHVVGLDWTFTFPVTATIVSIVVSVMVGVIFGLYPARKASRKQPIEALRYE